MLKFEKKSKILIGKKEVKNLKLPLRLDKDNHANN